MLKAILCLLTLSVLASPPPIDLADDHQIAVQNTILAKVNGNTISVMDVKKKMDLAFHRNYSHLENSNQARHQFYEGSWRYVLRDLIDQELMLIKAEEMQVPLSEGDVRNEIETRFGPNIMITLDRIGLSYDEAFKMIRDELIVQRMNWWFIHSKAISQVTPQDIRQAFQKHVKENPAFEEKKYQVIVIRGNTPEETAKKAHALLKEKDLPPEEMRSSLLALDPSIQISAEYSASDKELSESHKIALSSLKPGSYSSPIFQKGKNDQQVAARIFFLKESTFHPAPQFENLVYDLRNELIQKAVAQESEAYLSRLRKDYPLYENCPKDLHPFTLK